MSASGLRRPPSTRYSRRPFKGILTPSGRIGGWSCTRPGAPGPLATIAFGQNHHLRGAQPRAAPSAAEISLAGCKLRTRLDLLAQLPEVQARVGHRGQARAPGPGPHAQALGAAEPVLGALNTSEHAAFRFGDTGPGSTTHRPEKCRDASASTLS